MARSNTVSFPRMAESLYYSSCKKSHWLLISTDILFKRLAETSNLWACAHQALCIECASGHPPKQIRLRRSIKAILVFQEALSVTAPLPRIARRVIGFSMQSCLVASYPENCFSENASSNRTNNYRHISNSTTKKQRPSLLKNMFWR